MTFKPATANRFANFGFSSDESDSDNESVDSPVANQQRKDSFDTLNQGYAVGHAVEVSLPAEDDDFTAVPKKKAHHMKTVVNAAPGGTGSPPTPQMAQQYQQPTQQSYQQSPAPTPPSTRAAPLSNGVMEQAKPVVNAAPARPITPDQKVAGSKKRKKAANNRFACFVDEESESESDAESEEEEIQQVRTEPVPPRVAFGASPKESVADYYGIVKLQLTQSPDEVKITKRFTPEVISVAVNFLNAKNRNEQFEFHHYVRPTEFKILSKQTIETTGITQERVDSLQAQPLDEVLRTFERFLKEKNIASINRKRKQNSSRLGGGDDRDFVIVSHDESEIQKLKAELQRKSMQSQPCWKKFINISKLFCEAYGEEKASSLETMLHHLCMEFEGQPENELDQTKNITKILGTMIGDNARLVCNSDK